MDRILVVEDDDEIAVPLARALAREGYDVVRAATGAAALAEVAARSPALVVLDIGLPDTDGLEVCERLKADDPSLPVLMLTARAGDADEVVGLDAGADDYVTKPFRLGPLRARVRALLRRAAQDGGGGTLEAAGVRVDLDARRAWRDGRELTLTPKEFDLLALLVAHAGSVVRREEVMARVWDANWFGSTKTLDVHVSALRRKLGDAPGPDELLTTVRGVGLRFRAP